ncbi:MAG TPA: hypothetical protein VGR90_07940, partial [Acidimicrobiales bacterium]|nr:hypothetical protein [Acidimicrobiales bacterium]
MRRLSAAAVMTVLISAGALSMAAPAGAATKPAPVAAVGAAAPATHVLTRAQRGLLLVALTFILGGPLLAPAPEEEGETPARPRL